MQIFSMSNLNLDIQRPRIGAGVLVINSKMQLLLGKRKNAHGEGLWSAPGGNLHFGETLEACAQRELLEETGLHAKEISLVSHTEDFFTENNLHYITFIFRVIPSSETPLLKEPEKCEGWTWFDLDNLPKSLFLPLATFLQRDNARSLLLSKINSRPLSKRSPGSQVLGTDGAQDRSVCPIHEDPNTGATTQLNNSGTFRKKSTAHKN